jgi:hypothetical protein
LEANVGEIGDPETAERNLLMELGRGLRFMGTRKKIFVEVSLPKVMICVLLCMSLMLQGCVFLALGTGAAAGAGTVAYIKGELQTTYAASLDRTYQATLEALKDLDYRIISAQKDGAEGEIQAKKIGGEKVKVNLSISGPGSTLVKIRVGIFGDEALSRTISSRIASQLGFK